LYNFIHSYQESSYDKIKAYLEGFLWK
jgi:hypothetical protein